MTNRSTFNFICAIAIGSVGGVAASQAQPPTANQRDIIETSGFVESHPDIRHRTYGIDKLRSGKAAEAFGSFRRAALYADKPSQRMVSSMYWEGRGVPMDRALAYAWADLAAERGYPDFVRQREQFWAQLSAAERERALQAGQDIYAQYGDDVAEKRLATVLRRAAKDVTGSRAGRPIGGALMVNVPLPGASAGQVEDNGVESGGGPGRQIDASQYFARQLWDPQQYRAWQDAQWSVPRQGRVDVGDLRDVRSRLPRRDADKRD